MTDGERSFELGPPLGEPESEPGARDRPAAGETPTPARAPRTARKRADARKGAPPRRLVRAEKDGSVAGVSSALLERTLYVVGLAVTLLQLFAVFNPHFGQRLGDSAPAWPWALFRSADGGFAWTWDVARIQAVVLVVLALAWTTAALLPPSRSRGVWALLAATLALPLFMPGEAQFGFTALWLTCGLVAGGILLATAREATPGGRRFLLVVVALMAVLLFRPTPGEILLEERGDAYAYESVATTLVHGIAEPDTRIRDHGLPLLPIAVDTESRALQYLSLLPEAVAALLLVVGLLALVGLGARWARPTAAILLGVLLAGALAAYAAGAEVIAPERLVGRDPADWPGWWRTLHLLAGGALRQLPLAVLAPLAAGLGDLRRAAD